MVIQEIGMRGVVFTYEDGITVYLIKGDYSYVLCDTHLGPLSMDIIKEYISKTQLPVKEIFLFNSHSDWDHIWGNCAFPNAKIIAHEKARTRMEEIGEFELNRLENLHNGEVKIKLPNITFSDKFTLAHEEIEFTYAPGHTVDSSLCFDRRDSILFVGDLVESPIPYLDYYDLDRFIKTLELIRSFPAKVKLSAHSGIVSEELIERNISYIQGILQGDFIAPEMIRSSGEVHQYNLNNRLLLQYEPLIRQKLGENFDYSSFRSNFMDLGKMNSDNFKEILENYLNKIGSY
jgi:cyclase